MELKNPTVVFTAESNVESHLVVESLRTKGIEAMAVEDQSGVSLWSFGRISQFHKPKVWVDKSQVDAASEVVRNFERQKSERGKSGNVAETIIATCEECGEHTTFPGSLDGTTQECSHCDAYLDVGEFEWDEDVGEAG